MKKTIIIITILCITNFVTSQSLQNLDIKYGINKFKLESSFSTYQANLIIELDGKVKYYKYISTDISSIFGSNINNIILGFYKNKLYYIQIELKEDKQLFVDLVYDKLEQLFGSTPVNTNIKKGPLTYQFAYVWQTDKTYLAFDRQLPNDLQNGRTAIWMKSNVLDNQIASDDF